MFNYSDQKGGTIKGSGTYGIIINPSVKCEKEEYSNKSDYVSKIVYSNDLYSEFTQIISVDYLNIKNIDPSFRHFIYPFETCEIQDISADDIRNIKSHIISKDINSEIYVEHYVSLPSTKEAFLNYLNTYFKNIIMPIASFDLQNRAKLKTLSIEQIFNGFIDLIRGLKIMNNNGIVHRDIKPPNIVFSNNTFKFIDFGLAYKVDKSKFDSIQRTGYRYWPIDYRLLYELERLRTGKQTVLSNISEINNDSITRLLKNINAFIDNIGPEYQVLKSKKSRDIVDLTNIAIKYFKGEITLKTELEKCSENLDIFSLLQSFIEILNNYKSSYNKILINEFIDICAKYRRCSYKTRPTIEVILKEIISFMKIHSINYTIDRREIESTFGEGVYIDL